MKTSGEVLARRKTDFDLTFGTPHGKRCLAVLAEFGHMMKTTMIDGVASAELEGRRQVVLKILGFLNLDYADIAEMMREEGDA